MSKRNQEVKNLCEEYLIWLWSRRNYTPPPQINILQQFQPSKTVVPKDHKNSPLMAAFHRAILAAYDRDPKKTQCFAFVLFPQARPKPIKWLAWKLGINKDTVNEWGHQIAPSILSTAIADVKTAEMMSNGNFTFN